MVEEHFGDASTGVDSSENCEHTVLHEGGSRILLEYIALGLLIFVGIVFFYGIIGIHDIPYEIAKKRGHPHLEAIHYAGWVSMFTLHSIWPFLWIWATIYHADRGYGFSDTGGNSQKILAKLEAVERRVESLERGEAKSAPGAGDTVDAPELNAAGEV